MVPPGQVVGPRLEEPPEREVTVRGGILNLTDQKYFEWPNVRGRSAADPAIDRYSSPGISGLVSVSYGW